MGSEQEKYSISDGQEISNLEISSKILL